MLARLLVLFITVPLVELMLLLLLADATSTWFTILLVIVTGVVGSMLARSQGWRTYRQIHDEMSKGRMPADAMVDALLIFFAGGLLLTPGILTDLVGITLLIPVCRRFYRRRLVDGFKKRFQIRRQTFTSEGFAGEAERSGPVIESYIVKNDDPPDGSPDES